MTVPWVPKPLLAVQELLDRDCDGILVVAQNLEESDLGKIASMSEKVVFVDRPFAGNPDAAFNVAHQIGGRLAAEHLWSFGHRHFAFVTDSLLVWSNAAKLDGFRAEIFGRGAARESIEVFESAPSYQGGCESAIRILEAGFGGTAVFCSDDSMAAGVAAGLRIGGFSVPDEFSVVGYGDSYAARYCSPPLTTVAVPTAEVAQQAVRSLLRRCYGIQCATEREFSPCLVRRESSSSTKSDRGS